MDFSNPWERITVSQVCVCVPTLVLAPHISHDEKYSMNSRAINTFLKNKKFSNYKPEKKTGEIVKPSKKKAPTEAQLSWGH